jgi:hypothetical protein
MSTSRLDSKCGDFDDFYLYFRHGSGDLLTLETGLIVLILMLTLKFNLKNDAFQ